MMVEGEAETVIYDELSLLGCSKMVYCVLRVSVRFLAVLKNRLCKLLPAKRFRGGLDFVGEDIFVERLGDALVKPN